MAGRYRNWCFTHYPEQEGTDWEAFIGSERVTYAIRGRERCPTTQRLHWQCYAEFDSALRLSQVRALPGLPAAHWEARRGTQAQAMEYCKKDGDWDEYGRPKSQGKAKAADDAMQVIRDGGNLADVLEQVPASCFLQYHRGLETARMLLAQAAPQRANPPQVEIHWGRPECGKTRCAVDAGAIFCEWREPFMVSQDVLAKTVVFDDFDPRTMRRSTFLRLTDRYNTTVEVKGASAPWRPEVIYFTSNMDPEEWVFACGASWDGAARRRITRIHHYQ